MATVVPILDNAWMTTYWTPSSGASACLMIDEGSTPDNDSTYITAAITITDVGTALQLPAVKFGPITYNGTPSGFTLTFNARNEALGSLNLLWVLTQGDPVGANTHLTSGSIIVNSTGYGVPKTVALPPAAMQLVSNWNDLWLQPYSQGVGVTMRITNAFLTTPELPAPTRRVSTLPLLGAG